MKYTVVDSHTHIIPQREPVWGWGPNFTVERLLAMMDRDYEVMGEIKHVEKALVMTGLGLTSVDHRSMREAHEYTLTSIKKHSDRLYLNAVINPRAWVPDQLDQLAAWKDEYNLRMLKIHPSMHNYFLPTYSPFPGEASKKMIYPIFEQALSLDMPLMIHMGETPYAMPAQIAPVAAAFPQVPIIVAHSGANNIPANANDAILLARTHDNIYLGTSWVQPPELVQMYYAIGASKMIWESDCSPQAMGQTLRLVTNLHLAPPLGVGASKDEVYQMIGGNITELCHLSL
ncbi:MAG: amidohydrolase [Chloroflexi bacterium]|nr:amidohydrolase [Chloroflexota bacterium]